MKILILDHYDSFSTNLEHLFRYQGAKVLMYKSDSLSVESIIKMAPDGIVLSPGPGNVQNPQDMGNSQNIVEAFMGKIPFLGVCLGHQLLALVAGATIAACPLCHGKKEKIQILHPEGILKDFPDCIEGMRYHSFCVLKETLPETFLVTATTNDGLVMAFENKSQKLFGVQFHPESVGTPLGYKIAENFLSLLDPGSKAGK